MFQENLKKAMQEKGFTVTELSQATGIGKSSISQYLSGKNIPTEKRVQVFADALGVQSSSLIEIEPVITVVKQADGTEKKVFNVPVELAAKLMNKNNSFVRVGLQQGILPFGYAIKNPNSSKFSYYISSEKFTEYTGIQVTV